MTLARSCTVVFVGTGDPAALSPSAREALCDADSLVTWIEPPAGLLDRPVVRLDTPSRQAWKPALADLRGAEVAYLAPGHGPDDDPGVAIVREVMADAGVAVELIGLDAPYVSGPVVLGPAAESWQPDPALAAVIRGVRDPAELNRWRRTLAQEFGPAVHVRARAWTSTTWIDAGEHPASFPLTLRAEPTEESRRRSTSRLREIFETLRGPDGCPWDRAQTHASLRKYVLEEAAEVVDAIDAGDPGELAGELGDLLANIALHAEIARQAKTFAWPDVVQGITAKMVRRHPHVFGEQTARQLSEVAAIWQRAKRAEAPRKGKASPNGALPALTQAARLAGTLDGDAASANLPQDAEVALNSYRNSGILTDDSRAGGRLLGLALAAKNAGIDPEIALRDALRRVRAELAGGKSAPADSSSADEHYVK